MVATVPRPLSRRASTTKPLAGASTGGLSIQALPACNNTFSNKGVDTLTCLCRHRKWGIATVFFRHNAFRDQLLRHAISICCWFIDLIDLPPPMVRLAAFAWEIASLGLRHHAVISRHHQNNEYRSLLAHPRTHRCKTLRDRAYRGK